MNKTREQNLRQLLAQLDSYKSSDLVAEEIASITEKLKESTVVRNLQKFRDEISKFKNDFDLQPILKSISDLEKQVKIKQDELRIEFETKLKNLPKPPKVPDLTEELVQTKNDLINNIVNSILDLRVEFETKLKNINIQDDLTWKQDLQIIRLQMQDLVENDLETDKQLKEQVEKGFKNSLEKLRQDIYSQIQNIGGGSIPLQINVGSSVVSTRYADINFLAGTGVTLTKADDNTNKRANITIATSGGGGFTSILTASSVTGANVDFVFSPKPTYIVSDSAWYRENKGWTYSGSIASMSVPPVNDIWGVQ